MDFRRNWSVLALTTTLAVGGAVAGSEQGRVRAGAAGPNPGVGSRSVAPFDPSVPGFHWERSLDGGSNGFDAAASVAFDDLGNVAAAGTITDSMGRRKFAVARINFQGNLLWVRTLAGPGLDGDNAATAVAVDRTGNIAAAGWLDNGISQGPDRDFVVMKWQPNGDPLWSGPQTFNGGVPGGSDAATSIAMDSVGNVIAGGYLEQPGEVGSSRDLVAMKFAGSDGVRTVWFTRAGGDEFSDEALCVAVDYDPVKAGAGVQEDFVAGGYVSESEDQKFYVAKLNGDALPQDDPLVWEYVANNAAVPEGAARSIAVDVNHIVVAGGTIDNGSGSAYAVVKLGAADGSPVWPNMAPTPNGIASFYSNTGDGDELAALAIDANGDIVSTGTTGLGAAVSRLAIIKFLGADGSTQFIKELSGSGTRGSNRGHDVAVLSGNAIVAVGQVDDTATGVSFVALKVDSAGNPIWNRKLNGDGPDVESAVSVAVDGAGNIAAAGAKGSSMSDSEFTVALVDMFGPQVTFLQATPDMLPPSGGQTTIIAQLEENLGIDYVTAEITLAGGGVEVVSMTRGLGMSPSFPLEYWSVTHSFDPNPNPSPAIHHIKLIAGDYSGNMSVGGAEQVEVQGDTNGPVISQCNVDPRRLDYNGGDVLISANVFDDVEVDQVEAKVTHPDGQTNTFVTLSHVTGDLYEGVFSTFGNTSTGIESYGVDLEAVDTAGNANTMFCGTIQVEPRDITPPTILDCQVTPRNFPSSGGTVNLSARAQDNSGVEIFKAIITRPDGGTDDVILFRDESSYGSGQYAVPANPTAGPRQYQVRFYAEDGEGNFAEEPCGNFSVAAGVTSPPQILSCNMDRTVVPPAGGPVVITSDVTDPEGVSSVSARIVRPDGTVTTVAMPRMTGDTFTGTFAAPSNPGPQDAVYTVFIVARDTSNATAVLRCGTVTVETPDIAPPVFQRTSLLPSHRSAAGGAFFIEAEVSDNRGVVGVVATVTGPNSFSTTIPLMLVGNVYEGTFNGPPNSSGVDEEYAVSLEARDAASNATTAFAGIVSVLRPDSEPPVLVNCDVRPRAFLSAGGTVRFLADATDNAGVERVEVRITGPGATMSTVVLFRGEGGDFEGQTVAPSNPGPGPATYAVEFAAIDTSGNVATVDCGTYEVAAPDASAPLILSCQVVRRNFISSGGATQIVATVTDDVGVALVQAAITRPDESVIVVPMALQPDGRYAGTYVVPPNDGGSPSVHTVEIRARDTSNNLSTASCGTITVAVEDVEPPLIINGTLAPRALGSGGGVVSVEADVTDDVSVASVVAEVQRPDGTLQMVTLSSSGGSRYAGTFNVPANPDLAPKQYQVRIVAADPSSNVARASLGAVDVGGDDRAAPVIADCNVSPPLLSFTGGPVNILANVTDNVGVTGVAAVVTRGGALIARVPMAPGSGSSFAGAFSAPVNRTGRAQSYEVALEAMDAAGNTARVPCGTFEVAADTVPPVILACDVTPRELPAGGGTITITATVTDAIPLANVVAVVVRPNGNLVRVTLQAAGSDTFTGQWLVPANDSPGRQTYAVNVDATDLVGNLATSDCGSVFLAVQEGGRVDLSSSNVGFGRVRYGTRVTRQLIIRNRSRTSRLAGTLSTLVTPFSFRVEGGSGALAINGPGEGGGSVFEIGPGDSLIVNIAFSPRQVSRFRDRLLITTTDPRRPRLEVRITGQGCRNGRRGTEIPD